MRAWNKAAGEPWAITEDVLHTILEIAARENETPEAVAAKLGRELKNTRTSIERDGVAIIPVVGPLFRYANMFTQVSGASSYEIIAKDFSAALENPDIHGIILNIDSPGGEVNGCAELASMIYDARGKKPIIAYASGDAASGAYWIASSADTLVVSETSGVGSIGVVGVYRCSKETEQAVEIISSQSPYKRLDASSEEGRIKLQSRIDAMAEVFVRTVARNRGVDPPTVLNQFGGGDILIGEHAVTAGLADKLGSLEKLITTLSEKQNPAMKQGFVFNPIIKETIMNLETLAIDHPDLLETIQTKAKADERKRISDILSSGHNTLADHLAFETDLPEEAAASILAKAPKTNEQSGNSFDQVMRDLGNPKIASAFTPDEEDPDLIAQRLANYHI